MTDNNPHKDDNKSFKSFTLPMTIAAWVIVLAMLTFFFKDQLEFQRNPNQKVMSQLDQQGQREVVLQRNRYGHYHANGSINGVDVEFMLDTGASDVVIPAHIASRLRLKRGPAKRYRTANGDITAYLTNLSEIDLGGIVMHDIRASINPAMDNDEILLGMSFLKQLEFTQRGDVLILRPYH